MQAFIQSDVLRELDDVRQEVGVVPNVSQDSVYESSLKEACKWCSSTVESSTVAKSTSLGIFGLQYHLRLIFTIITTLRSSRYCSF